MSIREARGIVHVTVEPTSGDQTAGERTARISPRSGRNLRRPALAALLAVAGTVGCGGTQTIGSSTTAASSAGTTGPKDGRAGVTAGGASGTDGGLLQLSFADAGATDARIPPSREVIEELRARVPGSLGVDALRELAGLSDEELGGSLDRLTPDVTRFLATDVRPLTRWYKAVSNPNASRTLRLYVARLEEVQRRGGLAHRPVAMAEEAELLPLVGLAIPEWALTEIQRRVQRYPSLSSIPAGDFEWNRVRDTARWATQRLAELARTLGARPGPAGQRVRELYAPWLLDAGQPDEAARLLTAMEHAPGHATPGWVYQEARALAAVGRDDEAARVMATLPAPSTLGEPEATNERYARLRVRAASLERSTREPSTAQALHDRVWALLLLGRYGEARTTALDAPAAIASDPMVQEARAVAMAVDGEPGTALWAASEGAGPAAREGLTAVRVHAAMLRAGLWSFPRRTSGADWHGPDPDALAELRRLLPAVHTAEPVPVEPLRWHLDLLTLPASPAGPAQTPEGRRLMATLDAARAGNNKLLQLYAAMMELVLLGSSGEPQRAVELMRGVRAEPDNEDVAHDALSLAASLATLLDPSEANRDGLYADLEERVSDERNSGEERVATALMFDAHSIARYLSSTEGEAADQRAELGGAVRRTVYELERRLEGTSANASSGYPAIFLQGFLLADDDSDALAFINHVPDTWATRYGAMLAGVRWAWAGQADRADEAFHRCASDDLPPSVAARCARWLSHLAGQRHDASQQRRANADAERFANLARATDGPMAATHVPGPGGDVIPVLSAWPATDIDLESWRLTHAWKLNVAWVLAPDVPAPAAAHHGTEPHH